MSSSDSSRAAQADELMHSAKKHMQKGFLKKPKYDDAADEYDRAAKLYAHLQDVAKASEAYQSASYAHEKAKNDVFSARAMEQLGTFLVEDMASPLGGGGGALAMAIGTPVQANRKPPAETLGLLFQGAKAFEEAAKKYVLAGKLDKQGDMLNKAATAYQKAAKLEPASADPMKSDAQQNYLRVVQESFEVMENSWDVNERRPYQMPDMYRKYIAECLRGGNVRGAVQAENRLLGIVKSKNSSASADPNSVGDYDDAKNIFRALNQPTNAAKAGLEIIVMCLSSGGDDIWALQELDVLGGVFGFCGSAEEQAAAALIAAYVDRDDEALQEAIKTRHCFNFLSADVSRMAKKLSIGGGKAAPAPGSVPLPSTHAAVTPATNAVQPVPQTAGGPAAVASASSQPQQQQQHQEEEEEFIDPEEDLR